jgi:hypothetical protein
MLRLRVPGDPQSSAPADLHGVRREDLVHGWQCGQGARFAECDERRNEAHRQTSIALSARDNSRLQRLIPGAVCESIFARTVVAARDGHLAACLVLRTVAISVQAPTRKGSDAMKFEEIDTRTREFDGLYEQWLLAAHAADEFLEDQAN